MCAVFLALNACISHFTLVMFLRYLRIIVTNSWQKVRLVDCWLIKINEQKIQSIDRLPQKKTRTDTMYGLSSKSVVMLQTLKA